MGIPGDGLSKKPKYSVLTVKAYQLMVKVCGRAGIGLGIVTGTVRQEYQAGFK
jgi:hypothetical protein